MTTKMPTCTDSSLQPTDSAMTLTKPDMRRRRRRRSEKQSEYVCLAILVFSSYLRPKCLFTLLCNSNRKSYSVTHASPPVYAGQLALWWLTPF